MSTAIEGKQGGNHGNPANRNPRRPTFFKCMGAWRREELEGRREGNHLSTIRDNGWHINVSWYGTMQGLSVFCFPSSISKF